MTKFILIVMLHNWFPGHYKSESIAMQEFDDIGSCFAAVEEIKRQSKSDNVTAFCGPKGVAQPNHGGAK